MIKFQFLLDRKYLNTEKRHLIHILISIYHLASSEKKFYESPLPPFHSLLTILPSERGRKLPIKWPEFPSINSYFNPRIPGKDKVSIDPRNSQSAESAGINSRRRRFCKTVLDSVLDIPAQSALPRDIMSKIKKGKRIGGNRKSGFSVDRNSSKKYYTKFYSAKKLEN